MYRKCLKSNGQQKNTVKKKKKINRNPIITCCAFGTECNRVVRGEVAMKNKTFKMKDVKMLMEKALANVTVEERVNAIKHTKKIEKECWRMEFLGKMPTTPPLIIRVDSHEDSETQPEFDKDD